MNLEQIHAMQQEAKTILDQRGKQWGNFGQFVDELYTLKDSFRILALDVVDSTKHYRISCFIYEILCLKIVRAVIVTRNLGRFDVSDSRLKDCAIDFINYCTLFREIMPFRLSFKELHTEQKWEWFFESIVSHIAFGGKDDTKS